jgi:hypothetical protein
MKSDGPAYTEIDVYSFYEFIKQIGDLSSITINERPILTIYRGQEEGWSLLPKIGRNRELSKNEILDKEKNISEEFKRLSYPYLDSNLKYNKWDLLALALVII